MKVLDALLAVVTVTGLVATGCSAGGSEARPRPAEPSARPALVATTAPPTPRPSPTVPPDGTRSYAIAPASPETTLSEGPILLTVHAMQGGEPGPELWRRELPPGWFGIQWSADGRYLLLEDSWDDSPIWALSADGSGDLEVVVEDGYLLGVVEAWE